MKIIAHRGDSANFPENTPESWAAAYRGGALAIEADIRLSKDGFCICAHDRDLMRLFNRPERPEDLACAELLQLENADGGRIVVLADLLRHIGENQAVLLDLKDETRPALDAIWLVIAEIVPAEQRHLVIAGCHTPEAVDFFAALGQTGILGFIPAPGQAEAFYRAGAKIIRLWESDVTPERVAQLQLAGAEVWVTTGGDGTGLRGGETTPENLAGLIRAGVDGVLVDDVAMARSAVEAAR